MGCGSSSDAKGGKNQTAKPAEERETMAVGPATGDEHLAHTPARPIADVRRDLDESGVDLPAPAVDAHVGLLDADKSRDIDKWIDSMGMDDTTHQKGDPTFDINEERDDDTPQLSMEALRKLETSYAKEEGSSEQPNRSRQMTPQAANPLAVPQSPIAPQHKQQDAAAAVPDQNAPDLGPPIAANP